MPMLLLPRHPLRGGKIVPNAALTGVATVAVNEAVIATGVDAADAAAVVEAAGEDHRPPVAAFLSPSTLRLVSRLRKWLN